MSLSSDFKIINGDTNLDRLDLGRIRSFKIGNVSKEMFIAPLNCIGASKAVIESPRFFSIGFVKPPVNAPPGEKLKYTLGVNRAALGEFLTHINKRLAERLYPSLVEKINLYLAENGGAGPDLFRNIVKDGKTGMEKYWDPIYSAERDMAFFRVDPHAHVFTKGPAAGFVNSLAVNEHREDTIPKQGLYKARFVLRYLLLQPSQLQIVNKKPVSLSLVIDQLFYSPEGGKPPVDMVMDIGDFFTDPHPQQQQQQQQPPPQSFQQLPSPTDFIESLYNEGPPQPQVAGPSYQQPQQQQPQQHLQQQDKQKLKSKKKKTMVGKDPNNFIDFQIADVISDDLIWKNMDN